MDTVYIRRSPVGDGVFIVSTLLTLEYRLGDGADAPWNEVPLDLTYGKTNRLVDSITEFQEQYGLLRWRGCPLWQYIPSYIWPQLFACVVYSDGLRELAEICKKKGLTQKFIDRSEIDQFSAIWDRLLEEQFNIPRKRSSGFLRNLARNLGLHHIKHAWKSKNPQSSFEPDMAEDRIMFVSHSRYFDRGKTGDVFDTNFSPLAKVLKERFGLHDFVGIDCPYATLRETLRPLAAKDIHWVDFFADCQRQFGLAWLRFALSSGFYLSFWARSRGHGSFTRAMHKSVLWPTFRDLLPEILRIHSQADRIVARMRPKAMIAIYETGPYARALFIAAGKRDIPTFGVMHGQIFENHYDYMHRLVYTSSSKTARGFIIPDHFFVWGELWKKILTEEGRYPPASIKISGKIGHQQPSQGDDELKKSEGFVIIMTANYMTGEFLEAVLKFAQGRRFFREIVVKPHPGEEMSVVFNALAQFPHLNIRVSSQDLHSSLSGAKLAIGQYSTSIFESALRKIPTILLDCPPCQGATFFKKSLCWRYLRSMNDLADLMDNGFEDFQEWTKGAAELYQPQFFARGKLSPVEVIAMSLQARLQERAKFAAGFIPASQES